MDSYIRTPVPTDTYKQVHVNTTTLHYLEVGTNSSAKPNLILSHGHLSDFRSFTAILSILATDFHVIAYSRRFSWPNTPIQPSEQDDWHLHARDLADLITTLNLAPAHILGNSSGATIPVLLAQTHPDLIASLILEEPPLPYVFLPTLPPSPLALISLLITHPTAFIPVLGFGINIIAPTTKHCKATPPRKLEALEIFAPGACTTSTWQEIKSNPDKTRLNQVLDNLDVMVNLFRYDDAPVISPQDLKAIKTPVLMVTGEKTIAAQKCIDWKVVMSVGSKVKKEVVVEGARHFVHEDQPGRVGEEVVRWVRGLEGEKA